MNNPQLVSLNENNRFGVAAEIIADCRSRWGDDPEFLDKVFRKADVIAVYRDAGGKITAFSAAAKINNLPAIAFLATRVLLDSRRQGVAKKMIGKISGNFIRQEKIFKPANWFKPVYFVSATANPIVFESARRNLKITPDLNSGEAGRAETGIAEQFVAVFSPAVGFVKESFVAKGIFLNSAECYKKEGDVPWSKNEETNAFLKKRINPGSGSGDGIVMVAKLA